MFESDVTAYAEDEEKKVIDIDTYEEFNAIIPLPEYVFVL